jgi:hypothetical protein
MPDAPKPTVTPPAETKATAAPPEESTTETPQDKAEKSPETKKVIEKPRHYYRAERFR